MARRELILDDLDGSDGAEPVTVTINSDVYELDLGPASVEKLNKALAPFTRVARHRVKGGATNGESQAIREWLQVNGYNPGPKGRISAEHLAAYETANAQQQPQG